MLLKPFDTSAVHNELVKAAVTLKVYGEIQIQAAEIAVKHNRLFDYITAWGSYRRIMELVNSPLFNGIKYAEELRSAVFPDFPDYDRTDDRDIPF